MLFAPFPSDVFITCAFEGSFEWGLLRFLYFCIIFLLGSIHRRCVGRGVSSLAALSSSIVHLAYQKQKGFMCGRNNTKNI